MANDYELIVVRPEADNFVMSSVAGDFLVVKNFTMKELACPLTRRAKLDYRFLSDLVMLRCGLARPLKPTSCCRSYQHNINVDGHPNSLHLMDNPKHPIDGTIAIDINTYGWEDVEKEALVEYAVWVGFSVGIGENFIHLDSRYLIGLDRTTWRY